MLNMYIYAIVFVIGNLIGSFLNVCIYRIPNNESVIFPPSHCPHCGYKIKWYDNIPIISYFVLLRGKCRKCKEGISLQYPIVEIFTGILYVIIFYRGGISFVTPVLWIFTSILLVLAIIDLKKYILPDRLTFALIILGFLFTLILNPYNMETSFLGAATYSFPFMLIYAFGDAVLKKEVMGFGDVKLGAGIGAFLGYTSFIQFWYFITISFCTGAIISLMLIALKIKSRKDIIPFGPFIALSGFIMALGIIKG
jgi:leader peptidase (prepilin peptidase)/N-methyltransferase